MPQNSDRRFDFVNCFFSASLVSDCNLTMLTSMSRNFFPRVIFRDFLSRRSKILIQSIACLTFSPENIKSKLTVIVWRSVCKFGQWSPLIVYLNVLGNSQRSVLIRSSSDTSVLIQEMKLMIIYFWRLVEWSLADLASGHMIPRGRYSAISQWRLLWW